MEKSTYSFVQDCLKMFWSCLKFFLVLTSLILHGNSKNNQFLITKEKHVYKYCGLQLEQRVKTNLYLKLKCEKMFWNISNLDLCCNSVDLNNKLYQIPNISLVLQRSHGKTWKRLQIFCPQRFSQNVELNIEYTWSLG